MESSQLIESSGAQEDTEPVGKSLPSVADPDSLSATQSANRESAPAEEAYHRLDSPTIVSSPPAPPVVRVKRVVNGAQAGAALISGLSSLIVLVIFVLPDWDPTNRVSRSSSLPAYGAEVIVSGVEPRVSFGTHLPTAEALRSDRAAQTEKASYTAVQLQWPGALVNFTVKIEGYEDRACILRWTLFQADGQRVQEDGFVNQPVYPLEMVVPRSHRDQINLELWMPYPNQNGEHFVRLTIFDDEGDALASADSDLFTIL